MAPEKPLMREDVAARPERVTSGGKVLENVGNAPEKDTAPDTRAIAAGTTMDEPSELGDGKIEDAVIPGAEKKGSDGGSSGSSGAHNVNNGVGDASYGEKDEKGKQEEVEAKDSDPSVAAPKRANTFEKEATFYEYFAEAVVHDKESLHESYNKAQHSQYDFLGPQLFRKEKDKLDIRSKQAVLHLTYTDFRIKELENEVKKLRRDVDKLPSDFELNKKSKQPVYMHKLKRSNLQEFRLNEESKNVPDNKRPALEVLVSERVPTPLAPVAGQESDVKAESPVITSIKEAGRRPSVLSDRLSGTDAVYESPERLRIRSEALNALLGRISGDEIGNGFTKGEEHSPVMYLRPFKLFVTYEAEIRASVQEVETRIAKKAVPTSAPQLPSILAPKTAVPDFDDEDLLADLKLLVEFLDVDLKPTFELRKKIKEGTATSIEYQDLWHLFEIGDDVVSQTSKNLVYRVLHYTGGREPLIEKTEADPEIKITPVDGFVVDCYNLHFNGSMYGPKLSTFSIRKYRGSQPINSLTVYPMKFDTSAISMKKDLLERGKEFLELTGSVYAHKMLIGKTLDEPPEEIDAQVIVDVTLAINKNPQWNPEFKLSDKDLTPPDRRETHQALFCSDYKYNEGCCGNDVCHKDLAWDDSRVSTYFRENRQILGLRPANELLEDDKLLLPYSVYGFVLRSRRWVTLNISDLQEVKYENNFDELVLPPGHKDTVKALVRNHAKSSSSKSEATSKVGAAMDLVRGKGKGLIILLHGEPGVGKTSTAECVADLTQRPLFPITCGDIGETAAEVQKSLDYNFQLAHKWGCVLLLDEADVFLTKRNKTDLRRNAVVSVFLRTLEYYSGILFLTTNRVGSFDPAFKSRIHMSLFYPHLDLDATIKLYEVLLKRTIDEQKNSKTVEFKIRPKEILRFAKNHFRRLEKNGLGTWNGRQIRNAFQTAIALVEYEARQPTAVTSTTLPSLGKAQFDIIAEASEEFDRYLKNTLGAVDADLARREQLRYDRYGEPIGRGKTTIQATSQQPIAGKRVLGRRNAKDPESEAELDDDEDDSDDDDDDDEDDDDDDDKEGVREQESEAGNANANGHQVNKIGLSVPSPSVAGSSASGARDAMDEEYEEFLRFQQMRKNKAKK